MSPFYVDYWCPSQGAWREAGEPMGYDSFDTALVILQRLKARASFPTIWIVVDRDGQERWRE